MTEFYQKEFQKFQNGIHESWLKSIQEKALTSFEKLGFPTIKQESWKYTSVKSIVAQNFVLATQLTKKDYEVKPLLEDSIALVFINGVFRPELSQLNDLPEGVVIKPLSQALAQDEKKLQEILKESSSQNIDQVDKSFVTWNCAFMQEGAWIHLQKNAVLNRPLELIYFSAPNGQAQVTHPRNVIVLDQGAQLEVLENYYGLKGEHPYLNNVVTEIFVDQNAQLKHYRVQEEAENAFHLANLKFTQGRDSQVQSHNIALGSAIARVELESVLREPGADCLMNGLYFTRHKQHIDNQTSIDHAVEHCTSREFYRGILDDESKAVFNGRILVRAHAQKTVSELSNRNLLLSKKAEVNTKPLLEIFADDVKCAHGATIGRLDESQVFYLRSRGIDAQWARHLLTYAFAAESFESIELKALQEKLKKILLERLQLDGNALLSAEAV
ncbi:MAG: Fe-S cluster assembly protein SufD [Deltaproteobacteria bacterium]|nr:Fe-S cluster assembly protein SufD [Deltaproteobacteria bacterium]